MAQRRVVITGMGIVSSIGNDVAEVAASLREGRSGIVRAEAYAEHGFRSQVHGAPSADPAEHVDRRAMRFHGNGTAWLHMAMDQAVHDAGLEESDISNERTGLIMGSGGPSTRTIVEASQTVLEKGSPKRIGPFAVPKAMSSTASATIATPFAIKGLNYTITSACSTTNHCIGSAAEQIRWGKCSRTTLPFREGAGRPGRSAIRGRRTCHRRGSRSGSPDRAGRLRVCSRQNRQHCERLRRCWPRCHDRRGGGADRC